MIESRTLYLGRAIPAGYLNSHCLNWPYDGKASATTPPADINLGWVRKGAHWEVIEPTRGQRTWNAGPYYLDTYVGLHAERGSKVVLIIDVQTIPAWATAADLAQFVADCAGRYGDKLGAIELSNEPSDAVKLPMAEFVARYRACYAAIKDAAPALPVVGPSCQSLVSVGNGLKFMRDFLRAGGGEAIDVLGVHLYPSPSDDAMVILDILENLGRLQNELAFYKPVWNTESGKLGAAGKDVWSSLPWPYRRKQFVLHGLLPALMCDKTFYYAYDTAHMGWDKDPHRADLVALWNELRTLEGRVIDSVEIAGDSMWFRFGDGTEYRA